MAKRMSATVTGVAVSAPIPLDLNSSAPFNVSLWVDVGAGCTYTIQCTSDDVQAPGYVAASGVWIDHVSATGLTVDCAVAQAFPVTAVRLNQTVGAAASTFTILQQGI